MGGLVVGLFWGALVSGIVLAALSLSSPLPPRPGDSEPVATEEAAEIEPIDQVEPEPESEPEPEPEAEPEVEEAAPAPETEPASEAEPGDASAPNSEAASAVEEEAAPAEEEAAPEIEAPAPEVETEAEPVVPQEEEAEPQSSAPATEIPLPAGSEFNRPPTEEAAAVPSPDTAPNAEAPGAPSLADQSPAPLADTTPLAQPNVAANLPQVSAVAPEITAPTAPGATAAVPEQAAPAALPAPDAAPTVEIRTITPPGAPVAQGAPEGTDGDEVPEEAVVEAPAPQEPEEIVAVVEPRLPTVGSGASGSGLPQAGAAPATPTFPSTTALPQVAVPGVDPATEPVEEEAAVLDDERAITTFAVPFDGAEGRPLLSIVLIDDPDSRLELSTLTRFTFPVTFVIDPLHPDAADRAATYREAGFEVAILASVFPEGATAVDVETAFAAAQDTLPEAVALVDTPDGRIQSDRPVLDAAVAALAGSGHGLLAFPQGLNAAEQSARREDVPGATLFRLLDDEDQRATQITRFLSRAAFTAAQEGVVVVAGHTRPDTVTALFSWALSERSSAVALAPLSAALLRASGE